MKNLGREGKIISDERALELVEKKKKTLKKNHLNYNLSPTALDDRDYLRGMYDAFCQYIEPTIIEGPVKNKTDTYNLTPREMWTNIQKFFELSIEHGQPITITGMALFCGLDREYLTQIAASGENKGVKYPKEYGFLSKCRKFVENYNEYAAHKKQNPAGPIFILKNFGWKDKFEIEAHSTQGALTEDEREAAQKRIKMISENNLIK